MPLDVRLLSAARGTKNEKTKVPKQILGRLFGFCVWWIPFIVIGPTICAYVQYVCAWLAELKTDNETNEKMRIPWHETKPQGKQNFASPGHSAKSTTQRERERGGPLSYRHTLNIYRTAYRLCTQCAKKCVIYGTKPINEKCVKAESVINSGDSTKWI